MYRLFPSSVHFPALCYFAIFASRCLIGRGNSGNFSVPDIIILFHALFGGNSFSMGAVIAKRLNLVVQKAPSLEVSMQHVLLDILGYLLGTMRNRTRFCLLTF